MSNLGLYQEFTIQAKAAGGVDALLDEIERTAVSEAAPNLTGRGIIGGAIAAVALLGVAEFLFNKHHARNQRIRAAKKAENTLPALTNFSLQSKNCEEDGKHSFISTPGVTENPSQTTSEGDNDAHRSEPLCHPPRKRC